MTPTDTDPAVPDDVAAALRRAASAVPPADLHPTGPLLRLQARRRRRYLSLSVAGVAAALLAVVAVNLTGSGDGGGNGDVVVGSDAGGIAGPDRDGADPGSEPGALGGDDPLTPGTRPPTPMLLDGLGVEWLPDGSTRPLPKAEANDLVEGALRLADGRLVTLANRPLAPGTGSDPDDRTDGAYAGDVAFVLAVFDPGGALLGQRDIRSVGGYVALGGEIDGKVVLTRVQAQGNCCGLRPGIDISTIDPTTFEERPLNRLETLQGPTDVAGGRMVVASATAEGAAECWLSVVEIESGETQRIDLPGCVSTVDVAVAPEGRRVAVVVDVGKAPASGGDGGDLVVSRLVVVDIESGEVTVGWPIIADSPRCDASAGGTGMCGVLEHGALTWRDDATVDVVLQVTEPTPQNDMSAGLVVAGQLRLFTADVGSHS